MFGASVIYRVTSRTSAMMLANVSLDCSISSTELFSSCCMVTYRWIAETANAPWAWLELNVLWRAKELRVTHNPASQRLEPVSSSSQQSISLPLNHNVVSLVLRECLDIQKQSGFHNSLPKRGKVCIWLAPAKPDADWFCQVFTWLPETALVADDFPCSNPSLFFFSREHISLLLCITSPFAFARLFVASPSAVVQRVTYLSICCSKSSSTTARSSARDSPAHADPSCGFTFSTWAWSKFVTSTRPLVGVKCPVPSSETS